MAITVPKPDSWARYGAIDHGISCESPDEVAEVAAQTIMTLARSVVDRKGSFTFAVSGGRTPWLMFEALATMDFPWSETSLYQVDERIASDGDSARNLGHLLHCLDTVAVSVIPMPVTSSHPDGAALEYGALLPTSVDLIHLGLGTDGHTASLVPDDPILDVVDQPVAVTTHPYEGHRRMSMTFPTLDRASAVLWVVTGAEKGPALQRLMAADPKIPAGRVRAASTLLVADHAALA